VDSWRPPEGLLNASGPDKIEICIALTQIAENNMSRALPSPPWYAAACQTAFDCPADRNQIAERTNRMCGMVEQTIIGYEPFFDVRLFVFPEFAHAAPIFDSVSKLRERLAVEIPNEHIDRYQTLCRQYGCYIQTGSFLEIDPRYPELVFNTTVLVGPSGILLKYRKVNPWIPWELHSSPHDVENYGEELFPVAVTELGKIGVAICYDWLFPEVLRQLTVNGAEILLRVSAYMDPWGTQPPMDWWTLFNRARAVENTSFVIASNQGAEFRQYPPFSWPGGSMIVDFDGRILAQVDPGPGEKVVVAPIGISELREARQRRRGHDMIAHLRSSSYDYLQKEYFPPAHDKSISKTMNEHRIAEAKKSIEPA
jgi:formamidase